MLHGAKCSVSLLTARRSSRFTYIHAHGMPPFSCKLACRVHLPENAHLNMPYMQVASRLLLPASAMFEAALSTASLGMSHGGGESSPMLTHAAIIAPCMLPIEKTGMLSCSADVR